MEVKPLKTVRGCPCGGVVQNNSQTHNPLTQWNVFVNVQLNIPGDPSNDNNSNKTLSALGSHRLWETRCMSVQGPFCLSFKNLTEKTRNNNS